MLQPREDVAQKGLGDGGTASADELARVTASNLDPEFGRVLSAAEAIAELG